MLFNMYTSNLSICLRKLPVGCCCGDMVVNHLMYADDIVLLALSAKGMQRILTIYAYGNDFVFNVTKLHVAEVPQLALAHNQHQVVGKRSCCGAVVLISNGV